jgi:hypothetical protein
MAATKHQIRIRGINRDMTLLGTGATAAAAAAAAAGEDAVFEQIAQDLNFWGPVDGIVEDEDGWECEGGKEKGKEGGRVM